MKFVDVERDGSRIREPLSGATIARLCRRAFGRDVRVRSARLILTGRFNTSYRIALADDRQVILRVAPPNHAPLFRHEAFLLRREAAVQRLLQPVSQVIPRNLFEDFSHDLCGRDYVLQSCLPGELWDDQMRDLHPAENECLWGQLAAVVRDIHAVRGCRYGFPHPMPQFERWSDAVLRLIFDMSEDLRSRGLCAADADCLLRLAEAGRHHLDAVREPHLVHGDLWPKNILVDRDHGVPRITGVLDAERAFWGDPEAEWIFSFLDIPATFWSRYGELSTGDDATFRRLVYTGSGAIKQCLEAWRFSFDDSPFRRLLGQTNKALGA